MASSNPISALEAAREFAARSTESSEPEILDLTTAKPQVDATSRDDVADGIPIKALPSERDVDEKIRAPEEDETAATKPDPEEVTSFAEVESLSEAIDVAGGEVVGEFVEQLLADPEMAVAESDVAFSSIESNMMSEAAARARAGGIGEESMQEFSDSVRSSSRLADVVNAYGLARDWGPLDDLIRTFREEQLIRNAGSSAS